MSKRRLGKGIDALLQGRPLDQLDQMSSIVQVPIEKLEPNPHQPRKQFNDETLRELADSIRERGIIQPILAEDRGDGSYVIIAGERRFRAARLAGLDLVPVISQEFTKEEKLEIALIENIQREDLNPIDEARAIQNALDLSGVTQEQLAKRLGKSRSAVANSVRLLRLNTEMQDALAVGRLTAGHARQLIAVDSEERRAELFRSILDESLTVRDTEAIVRAILDRDQAGDDGKDSQVVMAEIEQSVELPPAVSAKGSTSELSVELQNIQNILMERFGTRVTIRGTNNKGRLEIPYLSPDDLERILDLMGAELRDA